MNLILQRIRVLEAGIFSHLLDASGKPLFVTLEHAYPKPSGGFLPKIPAGVYTCVRGRHRLHGMDEDFDTFEVTGVAGHSGLLFHWGNFNKDSDGCILLGNFFSTDTTGLPVAVMQSRVAFAAFIYLMEGAGTFQLTVKEMNLGQITRPAQPVSRGK